MESQKQRLSARLSSYWKMEVGNALLVPAIMVFVCVSYDQTLGIGLVLAWVPMGGLLVLGGLYWRAKLHQLEGRGETMRAFVPLARKWRLPLLATTVLALVLAVGVWLTDLAASTGERWAITIAAALAGLEYVNYYHRQLQHFDHWADFRRLISGNGFAPSSMAKDLKRRPSDADHAD